jgi:hypothetical protein
LQTPCHVVHRSGSGCERDAAAVVVAEDDDGVVVAIDVDKPKPVLGPAHGPEPERVVAFAAVAVVVVVVVVGVVGVAVDDHEFGLSEQSSGLLGLGTTYL